VKNFQILLTQACYQVNMENDKDCQQLPLLYLVLVHGCKHDDLALQLIIACCYLIIATQP